MLGRLTLGFALLRALGIGALLVLLLNPTRSRPTGTTTPPLVLLDASLSMRGTNGPWQAALDSARRLAGTGGGVIWRFGDAVTAFDTGPPAAGASRLTPALAAAGARGGPVVVVTDGAIADTVELPADLRRRPRIVVLPRAPFFDAFVAAVDAPRHVSAADSIRLRIAYGTAGVRATVGTHAATLTVSSGGRRLVARDVSLPDSGALTTELTFPAARLPTGWSAIDVRLESAGDAEPRDDTRRIAIDVSPQPSVVVLGAPPDWESRFFAKTIADVAHVPVKVFVETEPGRWRDGATLAPVAADAVARAAAGARMLALFGEPRRFATYRRRAGLVVWPLAAERGGDWYLDPPPASPLAGALAGIAWDSLPPAAALLDLPTDSGAMVLLTARLARRGSPRPLAVLHDSAGIRQVSVAGAGLWRWGFRGGAPGEAYRAFVAAITDWLLGTSASGAGRVEPLTTETENGTPLLWRWVGRDAPGSLPIVLESPGGVLRDTLRFDAQGQAVLHLPPDVYRWRLPDGLERGLVIVEEYSDEWRPGAVTVASQDGDADAGRVAVAARDRWWWFALAIAAFAGEWAWRRRQGLP
ncbi:MAG TPA: hypothetical protein VH833_09645 [Gemmatimonadales bacterium]